MGNTCCILDGQRSTGPPLLFHARRAHLMPSWLRLSLRPLQAHPSRERRQIRIHAWSGHASPSESDHPLAAVTSAMTDPRMERHSAPPSPPRPRASAAARREDVSLGYSLPLGKSRTASDATTRNVLIAASPAGCEANHSPGDAGRKAQNTPNVATAHRQKAILTDMPAIPSSAPPWRPPGSRTAPRRGKPTGHRARSCHVPCAARRRRSNRQAVLNLSQRAKNSLPATPNSAPR